RQGVWAGIQRAADESCARQKPNSRVYRSPWMSWQTHASQTDCRTKPAAPTRISGQRLLQTTQWRRSKQSTCITQTPCLASPPSQDQRMTTILTAPEGAWNAPLTTAGAATLQRHII